MNRYDLGSVMPSANMMMDVRVISVWHHYLIREEQLQ